MNIKINTNNSEETQKIGFSIGQHLKGGEVIELASDLGGGKTTFVRGLASGAGSKDLVSSPSFTIENVYSAKDFSIKHFDFYRLEETGVAGFGLEEVLGDDTSVVIIEWAGIAEAQIPKKRLKISFTPTDEESRVIEISGPGDLAYLVEGL